MSFARSRTLTEKSISNAEGWAVLAFCMAASAAAIIWSWHHGAMLNYGDAVAHLHIARRVFDSRTPRLSQLGSVWLPLPHILLLPFVQNYFWWATGLAAIIPSSLSYIASCAGLHRLARHWLNPAPAAIALVFFALNPNLLYLQTTAMTEPLFLCEFIWIVVWLVEWRAALDGENIPVAQTDKFQIFIAAALVAAIFTRYDGWIIALIAWTGIGFTLLRHAAAGERRRFGAAAFWLASLAVIAAPLLWFLYNSVCFGDWLYFARGPYSAHAIELRTAAPGPSPLHPGWHSPWVALLFYLKVSELDSIAPAASGNLWGNIVLALAALGALGAWLTEKSAARRRAVAWMLLLWLPVPFYAWSVAYGSVPIFFPSWWPYTWYNTRYGLELLPALALGLGFAAQLIVAALCAASKAQASRPLFPDSPSRFSSLSPASTSSRSCAPIPSSTSKAQRTPTRAGPTTIPFPQRCNRLLALDPRAPVLMNTSLYPEIVAFTGIPLRQTINESDLEIYRAALASPATHAAIIVTFDGDEIDTAVKAHLADLTLMNSFSAEGQPSAAIYVSTKWLNRTHASF